jgi:hypothetical protein
VHFFLLSDRASMQNVIHTTKILVNPKIAEVEEFKNRYILFCFRGMNGLQLCPNVED